MRTTRASAGWLAVGALIVAACGGPVATRPPTQTPGQPATQSASPAGSPTASAKPTSRTAAALDLRAKGSASVCKAFATVAECAAFVRVQPIGGKTAPDGELGGDPKGSVALLPAEETPTTLDPGKYRITAHLDRVSRDVVLPPETPQRYVDRTCRADFTVAASTAKVTVRIAFDDGASCKVAVTLAKATPKPTRSP